MKYAFIFGTSVFLSEQPTVSYADASRRIDFLRILSHYRHINGGTDKVLTIDAHITSSDDLPVEILGNRAQEGTSIVTKTDDYRIGFYRDANSHHPILEVHQFTENEIAGLSSHIVNEIEAQRPDVVLGIKGDFRVEDHRILIENEKFFVDGDDYANGVTNAHNGVLLTPYGVIS
ncbi:hypothetical protein [Mucilaginibacter lacusdianchii]|uniref:hypothetical protein n=1 Tax=Mucilaginibacter lacusdianchii TaxID=2684211 RepID=UPI00131B39F7|nr:hypothetical protein [Mucilaginibacter sp. JXJ CY 39]